MECRACGNQMLRDRSEDAGDVYVCINKRCREYLVGVTEQGESRESTIREPVE